MTVHSLRPSLSLFALLVLAWFARPLAIESAAQAPVFPPPAPLPPAESAEAAAVASWVRDLPPVGADENHFSVIGALSFMTIGRPAMDVVKREGAPALYTFADVRQRAETELDRQMSTLLPVLAAGGIRHLRDVQNSPWGLIETEPGRYDYSLLDRIVTGAEAQGLDYVGVAMPFADWDLAERGPAAAICQHFFREDYFYLARGGAMDRYVSLEAFIQHLGRLVERYDNDGVADAPGLTRGVKYWQIHNEPEGESCGQFRHDPEAFVELMRRAYETVHEACADCQVLNGGAGIPLWREGEARGGTFWAEAAALGLGRYVDVIAAHYNDGKVNGGQVDHFETQVRRLRELLGPKPVWVTEFGVVTGENERFRPLSERDAAAWFVRFYAAGLAQGAVRFFSDVQPFVDRSEIRLPYYVNKLLEHEIGRSTAAVRIAEGQYRFIVEGRPVWVLWNGVPDEVVGTVTVTNVYGNSRLQPAAAILPAENDPLIVEP